jgi:hypothetical protein
VDLLENLEDGSKAIGLFNRGTATNARQLAGTGAAGSQSVRDMWRQVNLGEFDNQFSMTVAGHGAELIKVVPAASLPGNGWTGSGSPSTNWGVAANWNSGVVPGGAGVKVDLGDQAPEKNVVDMVSLGRTVGKIDFHSDTDTTLQSSGGHSLTLDNGSNCGAGGFDGDGTLDRVLAVPAAFVASLLLRRRRSARPLRGRRRRRRGSGARRHHLAYPRESTRLDHPPRSRVTVPTLRCAST